MKKSGNYKSSFSKETFAFLIVLSITLGYLSYVMGVQNFLNTAIATSYDLLITVAFWIMALAVLASGFSSVAAEFGVFGLLNVMLSGITKIIYRLPGVSALGAVSSYFSDNPAVISLAKEEEFRKNFKDYQIPVLCNVGTSFGMGFIVTIAMATLAVPEGVDISNYIVGGFVTATLIGLLSSVVGSVVSVRLLNRASMKHFGYDSDPEPILKNTSQSNSREIRDGNVFQRFLDSSLDGGKNGVEIGLSIIPGILIICTIVMILTFGEGESGYTGGAYEGIALIPWIGNLPGISHLLSILFQFQTPEALAFPLTAIGSAGAAVGNVPNMLSAGYIGYREIAIFTAMGITWSGYLSTHASMMDSLGCRELTGKAILSHTLGGIVSGIVACYAFNLMLLIL